MHSKVEYYFCEVKKLEGECVALRVESIQKQKTSLEKCFCKIIFFELN